MNENNYIEGYYLIFYASPFYFYFPMNAVGLIQFTEMCLCEDGGSLVESLAPNLSLCFYLVRLQCRLLCQLALLMYCFVLCLNFPPSKIVISCCLFNSCVVFRSQLGDLFLCVSTPFSLPEK